MGGPIKYEKEHTVYSPPRREKKYQAATKLSKNASIGLREGKRGGGRRYIQSPSDGLSRKLSTTADPCATRSHSAVMGEYTGRPVPT